MIIIITQESPTPSDCYSYVSYISQANHSESFTSNQANMMITAQKAYMVAYNVDLMVLFI